ncbi:MAG: peptide chain release factor N(5)-glutamine methyltransferase [Oscillospiraceae bacterium]|nr:peptide chain release factor N(5)-glutamine methyltransferase [Oscillospiraceae bacterium]
MVTRDIFRQMTDIISNNPQSDARFEADQLIQFVTGKKRIEIMSDDVDDTAAQKLLEYAQMRKDGYPLQYIIGRWQFFDMELFVGEGVLVPRQDTETVCEGAFRALEKMHSPQVLDLCSGSGCIALAVKRFFPASQVTAVEKSADAFRYLEKNIAHTGFEVKAVQGDVFGFEQTLPHNSLDLVISNPPYIDFAVADTLQTEVKHEPQMALFADNKGLLFYSYITRNYKKLLRTGGFVVFEYGFDQQEQVREILRSEGFSIVEEIIDYGGNPRGVVAQKTE